MAKKAAPVIVRRQKKPGHAPRHGGHWKVAYADFMTAMMAFFLLLWILSVTDKNKLNGIAQYFTPSENIAGQPGGEGILQGSAVAKDENVLSAPAAESDSAQAGAPNPWADLAKESRRDPTPAPLGEALENAGRQFLENIQNRAALANLAGNLLVRQIEGKLVVDILDLGDAPMFGEGSDTPTATMTEIMNALAPTVIALPHPIRITGHSAVPAAEGAESADPWDLSGSRAQAVRRILRDLGLPAERFTLISGAGTSRPLDPLQPADPRNRRVTLELGSALD
ncbi:flagellar motor protein MotB [Falsigemmobacter faecalis]|uniref:OmpA-like domain-containing protein n=1 Tax=Falsigemmobacter faecalis TaxID=2488730 RepID=A0A3P3DNH7_9RHOB|nr:flagellar motor protein MotB [Falsigemmobacter faecalis]RRH75793.1 hypothetical protein EG244_07650 [Falsigemmobacter faecalis]